MKSKFTVIFLALLICSFGSLAHAQKFNSENLFYITNSKDGIKSFREHADQISIIVPAAYHMDEHGVLSGEVNPQIMEIAHDHNVKVMPLFGSFDQDGIHKLLNDSIAVQRAIRMMNYLAKKNDFYGWQFDLENIHVRDGSAYTEFFRKTANALHKNGFKISMAVVKSDYPVPAPGNTPYNRYVYENWRGAFEIEKLVNIGDFISFMTYDEHTAETPPGPVAGIPWMKKMSEYLQSLDVPMDKISLGIPSYSDYWFPTWNEKKGGHSTRSEISYEHVRDLLKRYNADTQWMADQSVNYARWTTPNGVFNWLFIEDARSFGEKLKLVPKYGYRGFSVWVMGTEDPSIWNVLHKNVNTEHE